MRVPLPLRVCIIVAMGASGFCQDDVGATSGIYYDIPNSRAKTQGSKTVAGYRLSADGREVLNTSSGQVVARLPSAARSVGPELLGVLRIGNETEMFLGWTDPGVSGVENGEFENYLQVFRSASGEKTALIHEFRILGGPGMIVSFFQSRSTEDPPQVLVDIVGGAAWGTTYLVSADRQSLSKLFSAADYEFADLDHDGVDEIIAWDRRPFDLRCKFGLFALHFYPEIFVRDGGSYRKAWPLEGWPHPDGELERRFRNHEKEGLPQGAHFQITAGFADLDGDGVVELIVLQDRISDRAGQTVAVYRLHKNTFHSVSRVMLPQRRIAYLLGLRDTRSSKEVLVRTATPYKCEEGGNPESAGTSVMAFRFHRDRLALVKTPQL